MKIEKFKYNKEGVPLQHRITKENYGKYFKTRISRDGYKIKTYYNKESENINEKNPIYIELHSPRGEKKVLSSRGFRTYYRIICESMDELEQISYQLNHEPKIENLINLFKKKISRKKFFLWGMTLDGAEIKMVIDLNLVENRKYKQREEEFESLLIGYYREELINISIIGDESKKPDLKTFLSQVKDLLLDKFWSRFVIDSKKYLEIEVKDFDEESIGFYVKTENGSYYFPYLKSNSDSPLVYLL
jgi:hypothetical protein